MEICILRSAWASIIGMNKLRELSRDGGKLDMLSAAYSSYYKYEVLMTNSLTRGIKC